MKTHRLTFQSLSEHRLIVTHPITGETVNIIEDTEFEEELEEAEKRLADEMEGTQWKDVRHQYDELSDQATTDGGKDTEQK